MIQMNPRFFRFLPLLLLLSGCAELSWPPPWAQQKPTIPVSEMTTPAFDPANPPLLCKIGRGSALFGREWYDFQEATFYVPRGAPVNVSVARASHPETRMAIRVLYDGAGQKMIFCPYLVAQPGANITCSSLYALEDDLRDGIKRTFDIPQAVRGGAISCAYEAARLKSLAPPSH